MKLPLLWLATRRYAVGAIAITAGTLISPTRVIAQTQQYMVRELSGDDAIGVPCKLNNLGDIAGRADSALVGKTRASVWNRSNFKSKNLAAVADSDYSSAFDINDAGEVTGASNTDSGMVPFIWTVKGSLNRIPLLRGDSCGQAVAINKHGHVVGYSSGRDGVKAILWGRHIGMHNLGVLPGGSYCTARDVNDSDEVVGTSGSYTGDRAVLWTNAGSVRDLGTLPGDSASEAAAINNNGDVVGSSKGPRGMRAFIWSSGGGMQELGVLPGGNSSRAMDINELGQVVGTSTSAAGEHAFIWTKQTGIADLNSADSTTLGFVFIEAHAINVRGQIVVMGISAHDSVMGNTSSSKNNQVCAPAPPSSFLLTPVRLR